MQNNIVSPINTLIYETLLAHQTMQKLTYSNVGIQKFSRGRNPRTPTDWGPRITWQVRGTSRGGEERGRGGEGKGKEGGGRGRAAPKHFGTGPPKT